MKFDPILITLIYSFLSVTTDALAQSRSEPNCIDKSGALTKCNLPYRSKYKGTGGVPRIYGRTEGYEYPSYGSNPPSYRYKHPSYGYGYGYGDSGSDVVRATPFPVLPPSAGFPVLPPSVGR